MCEIGGVEVKDRQNILFNSSLIIAEYVKKTFPEPIDQWALGEAQKVMEKYALKKKGVSVFPVEKIHQMLSKVCKKCLPEVLVTIAVYAS